MNAVVALLVAVCVSVLAAVAMAFPAGGLNHLVAATALGAGTVAGVVQYAACRRRESRIRPARKIGAWEWVVIVVYTLFSLRAFCWLVFWDDDQIEFLSPNNLGDLSLHLTYINNFASGVRFWPENPIFAGAKLHYPVGIDIFNSLLKLVGMDVYRGLVCVGLAGCLVTGIALYKWGRGFALAGFLFNGGLAGLQFFNGFFALCKWVREFVFSGFRFNDGLAISQFLHGFQLADYQQDFAWKSIPLAMFVTQRGLLYAIPAGLALLWSWRARIFPDAEDEGNQPLPFWTEVLLYSTMPLFHLHTFIFLSFLLGFWIAVSFVRRSTAMAPARTMQLLKLVACSLIPATALIALLTGFFKSGSVIHFVGRNSPDPKSWDWDWGEQPQFASWSQSLHLPPFAASTLGHTANWIVNFGALPFFVLVLVYAIVHNRREPASGRAGAFVFPAVLMFLISYFVMFAPWDWDNTKLMLWCYLAVLPFLWDQLLAKEKLPLRATCCFMLYFSGFISLLGGIDATHTGYELAARSEVDGVASAVRPLPVGAVFAAFPTYNHPLLLNGRNLVEGYNGHLESHGIDYKENLALLESLLNGEQDWRQTARKLHARYLFWGKLEEDAYPDSTKPWEAECLTVAKGAWGKIYDLEAPAVSQQNAPEP